MDSIEFPGDLKTFNELKTKQKEFLIEHYRRCEAFWRHWTVTIWSLPSVAAAINIGAYTLLFGPGKDIIPSLQAIILGILVLLNVALTVGIWKHRCYQQAYGNQIDTLESYFGIKSVKLSGLAGKISASLLYVIAMIVISIISLGLLVYKAVCGS